jgi:hypothetical protein
MSVALDQLNRALKLLSRDCRKISRGFLVRAVLDALFSQFMPIRYPVAADGAVAVVHQRG